MLQIHPLQIQQLVLFQPLLQLMFFAQQLLHIMLMDPAQIVQHQTVCSTRHLKHAQHAQVELSTMRQLMIVVQLLQLPSLT